MQRNPQIITAKIVPEAQRMNVADDHFGIHYPLLVEPMIFQFATQLAPAYNGGYWRFFMLSNGGFYMIPNQEKPFEVIADNGYVGSMSAEALGITACLYTYSNLSFGEGTYGQTCADHYHWLYEFAITLPECWGIRAAID